MPGCSFGAVAAEWAFYQSHMGRIFAFPVRTAVEKLLYNEQQFAGKF